MKLLYFSNVHRTVPTELGVLKKVKSQCLQIRNAKHKVILACYDDSNSFVFIDTESDTLLQSFDLSNCSRFTKTKYVLKNVSEYVKKNKVNCIYSRYTDFSLDFHRFYNNLKTIGIKVLLEIPTYPISQRWTSIKQSFKSRNYYSGLSQLYSSTIGSIGILFFRHSIDRIVNVNGFSKIWGIPIINISNGVDVASFKYRDKLYQQKDSIRIVSVANIAHWHGYDRMIVGLGEYYRTNPKINVYLDLVGPGNEVLLLKKLVSKYGIAEFVKFYGQQSGDKLEKILAKADLGISVLGVHRNKTKICDSLKAKEFCARGIPFITEKEEQHFIDKPFVKIVPSTEAPIDIYQIVDFYNSIVDNPRILKDMRTYALNYCDWHYTFQNVIKFLATI